MRYVAASLVTDTQIHRHTHRTTTVTLTHAPKVNNSSTKKTKKQFNSARGDCVTCQSYADHVPLQYSPPVN